MDAEICLYVGPCRAANTRALAEAVRQRAGEVLWLTPTRHTLPASGFRTASLNDLVKEVLADAGMETISPGQRRLLVEEVLAAGKLHHFAGVRETAGFAERLLDLFDELHAAGIDTAKYERSAGAAKARESARLYRRYEEALRELGLIDAAGREFAAATAITKSPAALLLGVNAIVLDGFNEVTPGLKALLDALAGRVRRVHLSLLLGEDERAELWALPRRACDGLVGRGATVIELAPLGDVPPGLAHLPRQLFRPLRKVEASADAAGLAFVRAPGVAGEARLVARQIKRLLLDGVPPDVIDVVVRDLGPYADLLRDTLAEYGIPAEVDTRPSLLRAPSVALLLRALRLPDEEFPFAGVTAVLRHTCFRPAWPELSERPDLAARAEALLRLLAVTRSKDGYLAAVARWADRAQPGLEDETAEETRRQRTHQLAKECQSFLERFFHAWDGAPGRGPLELHIAWLSRFVADLGMARDERDAAAWDCLWGELRAWVSRSRREVIDLRTFARRLSALSSRTPVPVATAEVPRVLVLSADVARYRVTDYRFVLGLGERTFPRPAPEASLRDGDANADEHLSGEMLLFHEVVTGARRRLVLSYPAVDERGQELLPGSFLQAVEACFVPGAVEVEQRRMPIEGYLIDEALSPSELRARVGAAWPVGADRLPAELRAHLFDAAAVAQARFREPSFTPYDGVFTDPFIAEWAGRLFGPEKVLSPTALEDYIGCPFKFFLRHALRLEPLEDPREEVEVTRRGMAFHRALARLHTRLRDRGTHQPADGVTEEVLEEMRVVIDEDVRRAPGQVAKELWRLEGQRLLKTAGRYPSHWGKFLKPWLERGVAPRPHLFEADFGLPTPEGTTPTAPLVLRHDGVEVRLWGRIDRVDLAELDDGLGFWVIDYKTGRSSHYTGTDLAEFRKVQLTLYALAVEAVVLAGRGARPLGLAYWLVSESGPKVALPGRNATAWLEETSRWPAIRGRLVAWVASLASDIRRGAFPLAPRSEHCTQTCPYGHVCRITQARSVGKVWDRPLPGEEKDA